MGKKAFRILFIVLIFLFSLKLIPFFFRDARMWGFNHLIFLPLSYAVDYAILGLSALAISFMPFSKNWGGSLADSFSNVFFESPWKYLYRIAFISIITILFILCSMPTHFLGDGYTVLANISFKAGGFIKWSEKGITFILLAIQSLLGEKSEQSALITFRIVSYSAGIATIWFYFLIAQILSDDKVKRCLISIVLLLSGNLLLFFGYVENYPLVWVGLTGFVYFGLKFLKHDGHIIWPLIFLALGIFIHLQMAIFSPVLMALPFMRGKGLKIYRKYTVLFWSAVLILIVAGAFIFVRKFQIDLYFENMFLPLLSGKPSAPNYSIFSLPHLLDIASQLLLLSPLFPILFILGYRGIPKFYKSNINLFLFLTAISGLSFLIVIDPMLGMARDWDLFSICGFGAALFLVNVENGHNAIVGRLLPAFTLFLLLAVTPYLIVNLKTNESVAYASYTINLDISKAYPTFTNLLRYYKNHGDTIAIDELEMKYNPLFKDQILLKQAEDAQQRRDFKGAGEIIKKIPPDRLSWRFHNFMALEYYYVGDLSAALKEMELAIQLNEYNKMILSNKSMILIKLGRINEAIDCLNKAYNLDRRDLETLEALATLNLFIGRFDQAISSANDMISINSMTSKAYYLLTKSYAKSGHFAQASLNLSKYLQYGKMDSLYVYEKQELEQLVAKMKQ